MKESYECEVATHIGPESCGAAREGGVEALTRERAGRVFSRVRQLLRDADAVRRCGRPHLMHRYREVRQSPARSETPCTYGSASHGNREIPRSPQTEDVWGRIGKSKDARR
jgi:RNA-directed DNA polymerase